MRMKEAIESGRKFRRVGGDDSMWCRTAIRACGEHEVRFVDGDQFHPLVCDIVATDWEILEPTVTITRSEFWNAVEDVKHDYGGKAKDFCPMRLAVKLGLEGDKT